MLSRRFLRASRAPLVFRNDRYRPLRRTLLTKAFAQGPNTPPLLTKTIGEHFASVVSQYGDRTAVISRYQQKQMTYDRLDRDSNALARGLASAGLKKGDRCAVALGNGIEFATVTYAIFKIGAILVPLNPAFNATQVVSALTHLDASHLIIGTETNLPFKEPRSNVPLLTHIIPNIQGSLLLQSELVPSLKKVIIVDNSEGRIDPLTLRSMVPYQDFLAGEERSLHDQGLEPDEIINIQFTSGTTSMPKAACLTHTNILNNGQSIGDRMLLTPEDIVCCPPPLFHCFGCILGYMATATHASTIVFPAPAFNPLASLHAVQDYACTALYGVPTMFLAELDLLSSGAVSRTGLAQLRTGIAAGSSIPTELMLRLHRELNLTQLTICYGMTETSPVSAMTDVDDPMDKRVDSVGRLLPHVAAKIVDPADRSRILAVGERGELAVSGYLVMKGYWGDELRTREALETDKEGRTWMFTGDEASIDPLGYVKITGRIKDLIIRGGENIHPLEIENCLFAHPLIAEVSVVGVPDERHGEAVASFIIKRHVKGDEKKDASEKSVKVVGIGADEVRGWVKERLSHHLVPKYVFWVDEYPKTSSGKIQKFKLRDIGMELIKAGKGLE